MMRRPLRVLFAEDNPNDTELALLELRRAGFNPECHRVDSEEEYLKHLHPDLDIILSDYAMPGFSGPRALELLKKQKLTVPFIIISGTIGEDVAVETMKLGASDYLLKDRLARLGLAVSLAIEQEQLRRDRAMATAALEKSDHEQRELGVQLEIERSRLAAAQTVAKMGSWDTDLSTLAVIWSNETYRIFERTPDQFQPTHGDFLQLVHPEDRAVVDLAFQKSLNVRSVSSIEHRLLMPDDRIKFVEERWQVFHDEEDKPQRALGTCRDITERKMTDEELRWKTAFLEAQLNSTIDGILVVDQQGRKIQQNKQMADLLKIPSGIAEDQDDAEQLNWVANLVVDSQAFIEKVHHLNSHPDEIGRDEIDLKDGSVLDRYSSPVIGKDSTYYGRIWTFRDITQRRRAEAAMRESEERFRQLAEHIQEVFWVTDVTKYQILYVSPAYEAIWGRPGENLYTSPQEWLDSIHPDDRERVQHAAFTRQADGTYDEEYRIVRPDGGLRWIRDRAFPVRNSQGVVYRVVGVAKDITERKQARDQLREQARLLDKAQDAILVRDLDHHVLYWNHSAERLYGWTAAEAMGRSIVGLLYHTTAEFYAATEVVLNKGEWVGEVQQWAKDGRSLTVEGRWTLVRDDQGKPKSILAINTDITERKKLEHQFLRAQRMESIGTLAGGIAHDLNNVLTPILMSIELLKGNESDPRRLNVLATIEASAQRGADMVDQVLSFARGVGGQRMRMKVCPLIKEIERFARETFLKQIKVTSDIPDDLWTVLGDPTQVHQVLLNLCVNARDAMPDGGTLVLSASNLALDDQFVSAVMDAKPGPHVLIEVEDSGTGMPADVMDRIFEPFFTTKEVGKGTGLGLSTTQAIVKSHGGFIMVYSEVGKGTKFSVFLPAETTAETGITHTDVDLPRGSDELVLVVDDEPSVRQITRQTLEAFGYRVLLASDGGEAAAIYLARKQEIAVVITDMMMPEMDGLALIDALQGIDPGVRMIAACGLTSSDLTEKVARAGVNHFLAKPYKAQALLSALRDALKAKH